MLQKLRDHGIISLTTLWISPWFWFAIWVIGVSVVVHNLPSGGSGVSAEEQSCIDRGGEWLYGGRNTGYYCNFDNCC